jgi:tRNA-Thr(GGU) m(6)t(6)A37 methyltransferase TsaA
MRIDGGMVLTDGLLRPIGFIKTPFKEPRGTPIQASAGKDVEGTIEILPEFQEGLKDLDGFSHIVLLFHLHLSKGYSLTVTPFMDDVKRGVFATRAPARPNQIGLSIVRLVRVEGNVLHIKDVDIVNGTPLLDIKPYTREFDIRDDIRIGWLEGKVQKMTKTTDDGRFIR